MELRSPAFIDRQVIPTRYTCDGADLSPPLEWANPPEGVQSFAVLCEDPDAPTGLWRHWAAYDIPADRRSLAQGAAGQAAALGFRQGVNDFHQAGYGGPCPPPEHGVHRYHFRLLALSVAKLPLGANRSCREVEAAARRHVLADATLTGVYER